MAAPRRPLPLTLGLAALALAGGAREAQGQTTGVLQAVVTVVDVTQGAAALDQVHAVLGSPLSYGSSGSRPELPAAVVELTPAHDTKRPGEGTARPLVVTVTYLR